MLMSIPGILLFTVIKEDFCFVWRVCGIKSNSLCSWWSQTRLSSCFEGPHISLDSLKYNNFLSKCRHRCFFIIFYHFLQLSFPCLLQHHICLRYGVLCCENLIINDLIWKINLIGQFPPILFSDIILIFILFWEPVCGSEPSFSKADYQMLPNCIVNMTLRFSSLFLSDSSSFLNLWLPVLGLQTVYRIYMKGLQSAHAVHREKHNLYIFKKCCV
jgi:hypothetical protein